MSLRDRSDLVNVSVPRFLSTVEPAFPSASNLRL